MSPGIRSTPCTSAASPSKRAVSPARRRVAVVGCSDGGLVIALALANPQDVIAGFDSDPVAIAAARHAAARNRVSDRVTFEAAAPGRILGSRYDLVVMIC